MNRICTLPFLSPRCTIFAAEFCTLKEGRQERRRGWMCKSAALIHISLCIASLHGMAKPSPEINTHPLFTAAVQTCCRSTGHPSLGWHFVDLCALIYGRDMKSVRGWGLVVPLFLNFVPPLLTTEYLWQQPSLPTWLPTGVGQDPNDSI